MTSPHRALAEIDPLGATTRSFCASAGAIGWAQSIIMAHPQWAVSVWPSFLRGEAQTGEKGGGQKNADA